MENTFRAMFCVGVLGGAAWFGYVEFQPVTPLVEAVGVFWLALTAVSLVLWGALWVRGRLSSVVAGLERITRVQWLVMAGVVIAVAGGWQVLAVSHQAQADRTLVVAQVRTQCASFINREFNGGSRNDPARANGVWNKNGHIVVEVVWKENRRDPSYQSRLCVYNPETKRLDSPGAFGRVRWEQY